jgi:hypothetical protein
MPNRKEGIFNSDEELPIENKVILELVEEFISEDLRDFDMERLTLIDMKSFGIVAPEQDFLEVQSIAQEEIIQKSRAIFKDSKSYEQQHKNYRSLFVDLVEHTVLTETFGELEQYERRKLFENHLDKEDREDFKSFEKNAYMEIVKSKLTYHMVIRVLREAFDDAREDSFPAKLMYQSSKYGAAIMELSLLELENSSSEEIEVLKSEVAYYREEIEIEKKFLTSLCDLKFRDLFSRGYGSVLNSAN